MKKPTCDLPTYKNFKISETDSKAHAINSVFTELELDEWTNFDTLIMKDTISFSGDQSIRRYKASLAKISKRLNRYPYVKTYANQVNLYLQSVDVHKKYMEKFEDHLEKKAKRRLL